MGLDDLARGDLAFADEAGLLARRESEDLGQTLLYSSSRKCSPRRHGGTEKKVKS
jgi:hypothetical protein